MSVLLAPPPVGGDEARRLAEQELARPEYHRGDSSLLQRILDAIGRFLASITGGGGSGVALGIVGLVVVLLVVVAAVRAGRVTRRRREQAARTDPLATDPRVDHAAEADRLRVEGDHAAAVREYLRAAIAELERRGILAARPGRTATSAADEGGRAVPGALAALAAAARVFDETWFGARPARVDDVETARRALQAVRAATPVGARP